MSKLLDVRGNQLLDSTRTEFFFASSLSIPYRVIIAGTIWITTTKAQKPRKASTRIPLLYTLVVEEAKAHGAEASTAVNAVNTVVVVFMASSFFSFIPLRKRRGVQFLSVVFCS
jgi:hypothetical protein